MEFHALKDRVDGLAAGGKAFLAAAEGLAATLHSVTAGFAEVTAPRHKETAAAAAAAGAEGDAAAEAPAAAAAADAGTLTAAALSVEAVAAFAERAKGELANSLKANVLDHLEVKQAAIAAVEAEIRRRQSLKVDFDYYMEKVGGGSRCRSVVVRQVGSG
jgi:hypothetical protein